MSKGWVECLITSQVDGPALTNTTTPTSILPGQAKLTIPAGYFDVIGKKWRLTAQGRISCVAGAPGNLTFDIRFGSIIVANAGALTLNTSGVTNVSFELNWNLTARAIGSGTAANLMHIGRAMSNAFNSAAGEATTFVVPVTAPAVGTGFDSTIAMVVDLFATFSSANASNSIQIHQFDILSLN